MKAIKNLLFRWLIFFKGIRFYETNSVPKSDEFESVKFELTAGEPIEFFFFREECEDLIYRRGQFRREKFIGYVIQAKFPEVLPAKFQSFNNLKFFFNSKSFAADNEKAIVQRLIKIYFKLLRNESLK